VIAALPQLQRQRVVVLQAFGHRLQIAVFHPKQILAEAMPQ
jgi:hypothetical protein